MRSEGFLYRVRRIEKGEYLLRHVCPSVRPNRTNRLTLDEFLRNLIFECF